MSENWREAEKRFEFKRDPDNGMLIGPNGCHYDSEAEAFYFDHLEFCGCGDPVTAHRFTLDCLKSFDRDNVGWEPDTGMDRVKRLISEDPEAAAYVISYTLAKMRLLEHGSSIGGAWLTARGKQMLEVGPMGDDEEDSAP